MAAGRGTRMQPLTFSIPKAMAPLLNTTLIAYGISQIRRYVPNIHVTVGYKGAILAQHVIEQNVSSVFNTSGHGNAWWIFNTLMKYLDEPVFVLTCDNVIELDFDLLEKNYFDKGEPACMMVPVKPVEGLEGDYIHHDEKGLVYKVDRHDPAPVYASGIQIVNPAKINKLIEPVEDFYNVWNKLIDLKELYASEVYPKQWHAVDNLKQLQFVNELFKQLK